MTTGNQWVSGSAERVCVTWLNERSSVADGRNAYVSVSVGLHRTQRVRRRAGHSQEPAVYAQASLVLSAGRSLW